MKRISGTGTTAVRPARSSTGIAGYAQPGDPGIGLNGTVMTSDWVNDVQDEIEGFITGCGFALNPDVHNQMDVAAKATYHAKTDVAWERISGPVALAGASSVTVTLPSTHRHVRLVGDDIWCGSGGPTVEDIWMQMRVNGAWITAGPNKYYESAVYMTTAAGAVNGQPITDRGGAGMFLCRTTPGGRGFFQTTIFGANSNTNLWKFSETTSYSDWSSTSGWTKMMSSGLMGAGAFRIEAVRAYTTGGTLLTSGQLYVEGMRA
jgi:hypothetical protein